MLVDRLTQDMSEIFSIFNSAELHTGGVIPAAELKRMQDIVTQSMMAIMAHHIETRQLGLKEPLVPVREREVLVTGFNPEYYQEVMEAYGVPSDELEAYLAHVQAIEQAFPFQCIKSQTGLLYPLNWSARFFLYEEIPVIQETA